MAVTLEGMSVSKQQQIHNRQDKGIIFHNIGVSFKDEKIVAQRGVHLFDGQSNKMVSLHYKHILLETHVPLNTESKVL